jgi:hypothetical protein
MSRTKAKRVKGAPARPVSEAEPILLTAELRPRGPGAFGLALKRRGKLQVITSLGMAHEGAGRFRVQIVVVPVKTPSPN